MAKRVPHITTPEPTVGISEAARIVGVSADTIRRAALNGKIPFTRTPGGQRRFKESDVLALAEGGEQS